MILRIYGRAWIGSVDRAQAAVLHDVKAGMGFAKVALKKGGMTGWWNRDLGNIIGDLEDVVRELEARGIPRGANHNSPLALRVW